MSKRFWLFPLLLLSACSQTPTGLSPSSESAKPVGKDGVYTAAQESFGPVKVAVLVVKGDRATWYRFARATSTDDSASIEYGPAEEVSVTWAGEMPPNRIITGTTVRAERDDKGRLKAQIRAIASPVDPWEHKKVRAADEFILQQTTLTEPPKTLRELIDAQGPPTKIP